MEATDERRPATQDSGEDHTGDNFIVFGSDAQHDNRIGIYMRGSCDLRSVFACTPLIRPHLKGTCCIRHDGLIADIRSDLVVQSFEELPREWTDPVVEKLKLSRESFSSGWLEKSFVVPGPDGPAEFPKTVVMTSMAPDVIRTVYRHKEHGFLVDPGGGWLSSIEATLNDLSAVKWFRENFESIGRSTVDGFRANFRKLIQRMKENLDAHILVFNTLIIEPGDLTHSFQFVSASEVTRRRELNLALVELSRELDFSIVDVDRIFKRVGIRAQLDFGHAPPRVGQLVAQEAFRVMMDRGVFEA